MENQQGIVEEVFSVKKIGEGLGWLALVVLLNIGGNYSGFLSIAGLVLFPLPIIIMVMRIGIKTSMLCLAIASLATAFLFSVQASMQILLQYGVLGLLMGYNIQRGFPALLTYFSSAIIAAGGIVAALSLRLSAAGYDLAHLQEAMQSSLDEYITLAASQGYEFASGPAMGADLIRQGQNILPAAIILAALLVSGLCFLLARSVLRRFHFQLPELKAFRYWHCHRLLAVISLIGGLCLLYSRIDSWPYIIGLNIVYISLPVAFIMGYALLVWLYSCWQAKIWHKALLTVAALVLFWRYALIALAVIGYVDMLLNIRRININIRRADKTA